MILGGGVLGWRRGVPGTRETDGYLVRSREILPRLRQMDVPEETIDQIVVEHPRLFFEGRQ